MHDIIQKIRAIIPSKILFDQAPVYGNYDGLMAVSTGKAKYLLENDQLVGLNLAGAGLGDEKCAAIIKLLDPACLKALNLSENQLTKIDFPAGLLQLVELDLSDNQLESVTFKGDCPNLKEINLENNQLVSFELPGKFKALTEINLNENPIESPPVEIVKQGSKSIIDWYSATKKSLNEVKVLVIGKAEAGKTSLLRRLKDNDYKKGEEQTDGVIIEPFEFEHMPTFKSQTALHGVRAYFWDFGGQEIMRATHQFFMTNRSVYVLLLDARYDKDADDQVRQWMTQIKRLGGNSPVVVVINKIELNRGFAFNFTKIQEEFPQIKAQVKISCESGENIDELRDLLQTWLPQAELFNTQIDERWISIKEELQQQTKTGHYLGYNAFQEICRRHQLTDEGEQTQAVTFLNDLGIILHFDEIKLKEYYILDPFWVTYGVYRIITSPKAAKDKGSVKVEDLIYIVNKEPHKEGEYRSSTQPKDPYGVNDVAFLAAIMEQFKLCYFTNQQQSILIPDLLESNTPLDDTKPFFEQSEKVSLVYYYGDDLPAHTFTRFIVERHAEIEVAWRSGVVLKCDHGIKARALVVNEGKQIRIIVTGDHKHKPDYLTIIRFCLDQINQDNKVDPKLRIPLPGYDNQYVNYDTLLRMQVRGEKAYIHDELDGSPAFNISELLYGIKTKDEVRTEGVTLIVRDRVDPLPTPARRLKKIMFMFSSPDDKNPLDFGAELQKVQGALNNSPERDRYEKPDIKPCATSSDFHLIILENKPDILHLSMHASKSEGLYFEDENRKVNPVSKEELKEAFQIIVNEYMPRLCILSACNTIRHAEAILPYVNYVIGTRDFFPDKAATIYAEAFYRMLFSGTKIETAHSAGQKAIKEAKKKGIELSFDGQKVPTEEIPVLLINKNI